MITFTRINRVSRPKRHFDILAYKHKVYLLEKASRRDEEREKEERDEESVGSRCLKNPCRPPLSRVTSFVLTALWKGQVDKEK